MKPERAFWNYLRPEMKKMGHMERIESHATANGQPDVNFCVEGSEGNIELKAADPKKGLTLRKSQYQWFKRRMKAGGKPWILAKAKDGDSVVYLLIAGDKSPECFRNTNPLVWLQNSTAVWRDNMDFEQLKTHLVKGYQ